MRHSREFNHDLTAMTEGPLRFGTSSRHAPAGGEA